MARAHSLDATPASPATRVSQRTSTLAEVLPRAGRAKGGRPDVMSLSLQPAPGCRDSLRRVHELHKDQLWTLGRHSMLSPRLP